MHHNEARPVNCDGGRSSMKVQNQVRVWPVGQRTSSWHITDMWDRSVSKPISIDGKEPTRRSLRETRSENTQTGSHGGQDIFEHGWSISSLHVGLPFSALLRNKCVLYQRLKNKSTEAPPCGSSSSTTRTTKPCAWLFASSWSRTMMVLRMLGTTVYASDNLTPNGLMHVHRG